MKCLNLPETIRLDGGGLIGKERAFLYFIRRMATVGTVRQLMTEGFAGNSPLWSRVFQHMVTHVDTVMGHKLAPANVGFFANRFHLYSEAIRKKVNEYHSKKYPEQGPLFPVAGSFIIFAFVDGNCTGTCTPGGNSRSRTCP